MKKSKQREAERQMDVGNWQREFEQKKYFVSRELWYDRREKRTWEKQKKYPLDGSCRSNWLIVVGWLVAGPSAHWWRWRQRYEVTGGEWWAYRQASAGAVHCGLDRKDPWMAKKRAHGVNSFKTCTEVQNTFSHKILRTFNVRESTLKIPGCPVASGAHFFLFSPTIVCRVLDLSKCLSHCCQ